jgi:integrase/recombinase XerD
LAAGRPAADRAIHPVDAGDAPVETFDGGPADVGRRRLPPHLRDRGQLVHSPATCAAPGTPESPTLGLTHLQLEALLTAARDSAIPFDFALVCLLGLLVLRIFKACGASIQDLGGEHGHRALKVCSKGGKAVLVPLPRWRSQRRYGCAVGGQPVCGPSRPRRNTLGAALLA